MERKKGLIANGVSKWEKKLGIVLAQAKVCGRKEVKALVMDVGRKPVDEWSGKSSRHKTTIFHSLAPLSECRPAYSQCPYCYRCSNYNCTHIHQLMH